MKDGSPYFAKIYLLFFVMPPFEEERAYCCVHVGWSVLSNGRSVYRSVGRSVYWLVGLSIGWSVSLPVTFSFPINNSRTLWPTFLKLGPHICPGVNCQGHHGQRSRSPGSNVPKPFPFNNLRTPWPTFLKLGPHISPGVTRSKVKVTRVLCAKTVSVQ